MRAARVVILVTLVLPALLLTPGHVAAFCEILEPPSALPTQVNGTQVEIQLTEGFARIVIIKEFYNPSDVFKEGQVFFPLEKGHELITDLRLKIGNVVYNSSAGDRGEALDNFLDAVAQGQDAALVQYDPPRDVYWIAVTIPPREARTTITTLEMPLTKRDGFYEYHYRLSVDARDSVDYLRVHLRVETAAPLTHIHVENHPGLPILRDGDRIAEAYINDSTASRGQDLNVHFGSSASSVGQLVNSSGGRYVRYALESKDPAFAPSLDPLPRSFLVAIDASGSMGLDDRWAVAKETVLRVLGDLRADETFGVAAFGGRDVSVFAPALRRWTAELSPALRRFLDGITPRGSTSYTAAFDRLEAWASEARVRGEQPILVFVSDGRPTRGALGLDLENAFSRIAYERSMPIFALAVRPADHSAENLLRNLSHFQRGEVFTVFGHDPTSAVAAMLASIRVPVLPDIRSEVVGTSGVEFATANPQTLMQGGEALVLAKLSGSADDPIALRLSWIDPAGAHSVDRTFAGVEIPAQALLDRQWLLLRIHALLAQLRAGEDPATLDALTTLATENRVVTPYTSLLVTIPSQPSSDPAADRAVPAESTLFGGTSGLLASPGSGRSGSSSLLTPLVSEARRADALRADLANPFFAEREVDRILYADTPEAASFAGGTALVRFQGTYLQVLEVGDELIGVLGDEFRPGRYLQNAFGVATTVLALWAFVRVRRRAEES